MGEQDETLQNAPISQQGGLPTEAGRAVRHVPTKQEALREYDINIRFLSVGCVISVGCKAIPFTSVQEGLAELTAYINNPVEISDKWQKIFREQE